MRLFKRSNGYAFIEDFDRVEVSVVGDAVQIDAGDKSWYRPCPNPSRLIDEFAECIKKDTVCDISLFENGKAPGATKVLDNELWAPINGSEAVDQAQRVISWCARLSTEQMAKVCSDWRVIAEELILGDLPALVRQDPNLLSNVTRTVPRPLHDNPQVRPDWWFVVDFLSKYKTVRKDTLNPGYTIVWTAAAHNDYVALLDLGENFLSRAIESCFSQEPTRLEGIL